MLSAPCTTPLSWKKVKAQHRAENVIIMSRVSYAIFDTEFGWVGIVGSDGGLYRLIWHQPSPEAVLSALSPFLSRATEDSPFFADLPQRLRRYFRGEKANFPDRLDLRDATPFQRAVLELVHSIPYGETRSYAWVAKQSGKPKAFRARNPLPIIVPCHRVVGSDGSLVGFGSGLGLKKRLLDMEASI
jgi:methylated-DNA-[protein]-cysteine S-methyltransferase